MDLKYILCEPIGISKLAEKANEQPYWSDSYSPTSSTSSSPKSIYSSLSTSSNSSDDMDQKRNKNSLFIYHHRSSSVQTRTPWTPFEDQLLCQGYDQGLSWAMISATYLPHRSRGCCWGRFKTLQNKNLVDSNHSRQFKRPWKAIDFTKK